MSIPSFSLEGKVAIVTGGNRGIGKAIALTFAQAGADVAVCSRTVEGGELDAAADEIQGLGRRSLPVQADISQRADVDNLVQRVVDELGGIDILVNNAATFIAGPLLELSEGDWDKTIDTNLKGYYLCCQAAGKKMIEQKSGNIINIAASSSIRAHKNMGAYGIAKAGVVMLTKVLSLELASYNIRVNAIIPYVTRTRMIDYLLKDPEALRQSAAKIPLGRIGEPEDIANAALFLASQASSHTTGHTIRVDGGFNT